MVRVVEIVDNDYPAGGCGPNLRAYKVKVSGFATSFLIVEFDENKTVTDIRPTTYNDAYVTLSDYDEASLKKDMQLFLNSINLDA